MILTGYTYNSELEAQSARKKAANYYGLPVSPKNTTIYFVDYSYSLYDNFWYIIWCEGCTEVFGKPYEFTVNYPDIKTNE